MIHTRDLACRFADGRTLRFADTDVPQGGTLLLRGPSGSGKSTWLALAAGLLSATGGEMVVAGQSVGALAPAARPQQVADGRGLPAPSLSRHLSGGGHRQGRLGRLARPRRRI